MARTAKFDFSDYSLLDQYFAEKNSIPRHSDMYELIATTCPDYTPSRGKIIEWRNNWLANRGLDASTLSNRSTAITTKHSDIRQRLESFLSEVEELETNVNMTLSSPSEIQFLESQISTLETHNQQLLTENENLKGRIAGFEQAINHLTNLLQQRDIETSSRISSLEEKLIVLLEKLDKPQLTSKPSVKKPKESKQLKVEPPLKEPKKELPQWFLEFRYQCRSLLADSGRPSLKSYLNTRISADLQDFINLAEIDLPDGRPTKLQLVDSIILYIEKHRFD